MYTLMDVPWTLLLLAFMIGYFAGGLITAAFAFRHQLSPQEAAEQMAVGPGRPQRPRFGKQSANDRLWR